MTNKELIAAYLKKGGKVTRYEMYESAFSEGGKGQTKAGTKWGWGKSF